MKIIKGDLIQLSLEGEFDVIIHGCNCFCTMGAGIAKSIRDNFPEAYQADLKTEIGNKNKLGNYSSAQTSIQGRLLTIVNGYTQYNFTGENILVDYNAVRDLFKKIKIDFKNKKIGYPKIGAGLARGDWQVISNIICNELKGENHTLVEYLH